MFPPPKSSHNTLNHEFLSSVKVIIYITTFAIISFSAVASNVTKFEDEQVYIFPEIHDGDALQPTLQLLTSQKKYHEELYRLFEEMWEKNKKNPSVRLLSHAIFDSILVTGELLNETIGSLKEHIKNGTTSEDYRKEPLNDETCVAFLESWKYLQDFLNTDDMKDYGLKVEKETEAMQKVLKLAIREMEVYDTYLDTVYEETFRYRIARPHRKDLET